MVTAGDLGCFTFFSFMIRSTSSVSRFTTTNTDTYIYRSALTRWIPTGKAYFAAGVEMKFGVRIFIPFFDFTKEKRKEKGKGKAKRDRILGQR